MKYNEFRISLLGEAMLKVHRVLLSKIQKQKESNDMFVHSKNNQALR